MASRYDQSYKRTTDEDPRGSLTALAGIPIDAAAEVVSLDRELSTEQVRADHIYKVRLGDDICIHHFEALTWYRSTWVKAQLEHAIAVEVKYGLPVYSHLLLFQEQDTPAVINPVVSRQNGKLTHVLDVDIIRLWERPVDEVLRSGSPVLYPWAALMDATVEQQRDAARRIQASGREDLKLEMALLGSLRYGSRETFLETWTYAADKTNPQRYADVEGNRTGSPRGSPGGGPCGRPSGRPGGR